MSNRFLAILERSLLAAAVICLVIYAAALLHRSILSQVVLREFDRAQRAAAPEAPTSAPASVCAFDSEDGVDVDAWSKTRVRGYLVSLLLYKRSPLAVLRMKSRNIQAPVLEGTDEVTLNYGVGWIVGTARPGERGNTAIAGHRDGFFHGLKDASPGDIIELCTERGAAVYTVDQIEIVAPDAIRVLERRSKPSLTLVTCYPFHFVGSAPERFIVHATLRERAMPSNPQALTVAEQEIVR